MSQVIKSQLSIQVPHEKDQSIASLRRQFSPHPFWEETVVLKREWVVVRRSQERNSNLFCNTRVELFEPVIIGIPSDSHDPLELCYHDLAVIAIDSLSWTSGKVGFLICFECLSGCFVRITDFLNSAEILLKQWKQIRPFSPRNA
jgi:hypothetical protein